MLQGPGCLRTGHGREAGNSPGRKDNTRSVLKSQLAGLCCAGGRGENLSMGPARDARWRDSLKTGQDFGILKEPIEKLRRWGNAFCKVRVCI